MMYGAFVIIWCACVMIYSVGFVIYSFVVVCGGFIIIWSSFYIICSALFLIITWGAFVVMCGAVFIMRWWFPGVWVGACEKSTMQGALILRIRHFVSNKTRHLNNETPQHPDNSTFQQLDNLKSQQLNTSTSLQQISTFDNLASWHLDKLHVPYRVLYKLDKLQWHYRIRKTKNSSWGKVETYPPNHCSATNSPGFREYLLTKLTQQRIL